MVRCGRRLFVAVLGASNYTYAEATATSSWQDWIGAHMRAFEFIGACPKLVVPDNTKTGVTRACRYEPDLNPTYQEMAMHYGVAVVPARPYKPRDKAKVEVGVQLSSVGSSRRCAIGSSSSLAELNQAIRELSRTLNQRPFRKRQGCRASQFQEWTGPRCSPLPAERYDLRMVHGPRQHRLSHRLRHELLQRALRAHWKMVEVRSTPTTVEIFHRGQRVASHLRSTQNYQATTNPEHRPRSHQQHLAWPPSRLVNWAQSVGPSTAQLFATILKAGRIPEMGYRSCLGILRLGQRYSNERLEAAARRALATGACSYPSVKSILERSLDRQPLETPPHRPPLEHANLRGPAYFDFIHPSDQADPAASAEERLC